MGFVRNRFTPLIMASCCIDAERTAVKIMIVVGGRLVFRSNERIWRVAVSPSMTGIEMSGRVRSGNAEMIEELTHDDCVVCIRLELFQGFQPVLCRVVGEAGGFDAHFDDLSC